VGGGNRGWYEVCWEGSNRRERDGGGKIRETTVKGGGGALTCIEELVPGVQFAVEGDTSNTGASQ